MKGASVILCRRRPPLQRLHAGLLCERVTPPWARLLGQVAGPLEPSPWVGVCPWEVLPWAALLLCDPADVDECEDLQSNCLGGECKNTAGSYQCLCAPGFQLANGTVCEGEWLRSPLGDRSSECVGRWEYSQGIPLPIFSPQM